MNFVALGSWKFVDKAGAQRCPVEPTASTCKVYCVPTSRRRVSHSKTQLHWKPAQCAATVVLDQKPPSTASRSNHREQLDRLMPAMAARARIGEPDAVLHHLAAAQPPMRAQPMPSQTGYDQAKRVCLELCCGRPAFGVPRNRSARARYKIQGRFRPIVLVDCERGQAQYHAGEASDLHQSD